MDWLAMVITESICTGGIARSKVFQSLPKLGGYRAAGAKDRDRKSVV